MSNSSPFAIVGHHGGILITHDNGVTLFVQPGDDTETLCDEIALCRTIAQRDSLLAEYFAALIEYVHLQDPTAVSAADLPLRQEVRS